MSSEAKTQKSLTDHPPASTLNTANTKSSTTDSGTGSLISGGYQQGRKVLGTVKRFNVRNEYGFINDEMMTRCGGSYL
jgi:hypothetical protein